MRRIALLTVFLALLAPQVALAQSLEGVWRGIGQRTIGGPNDGQVIEYDTPRLLIYTDTFFMWAFVTGQGPRPLLPPPGQASDAEIAEVTRRYTSVAGTYIRDGTALTYNRLISLIPNQMAPENQPSVRVIRTLTANRLQTQATNADGVTVVLTYTRVE